MKKLKKPVQSYETITASDPFGLGMTLTVLRSGHKSLRRGNKHLNLAHVTLQREETLLLQKHRKLSGNPEILAGLRDEHTEQQVRDSLQKKSGKRQTRDELDHTWLYEYSPEYREAYEDLQETHEPLITKADQLDVANRVRKWKGKAFSDDEKCTGSEGLEAKRSILFDELADGFDLVPVFLDKDGNELEEGSELEQAAQKLSTEREESLSEWAGNRSALLTELREPTYEDGDEEIPDSFNRNTPVRMALEAVNFDPTGKTFGYFKQRCLSGVAQQYVADVTDIAADVYQTCIDLNDEQKALDEAYETALKDAGLRSTGHHSRVDGKGRTIKEPYAGYSYPLAVSFWINDLSLQAQEQFEKKSRRGMRVL